MNNVLSSIGLQRSALARKPGRASLMAVGIGVGLAFFSTASFAHVTLSNPQAAGGTYYKAVFNVPHGCKGSPTVKLRVRIPDGVISVKPQPKAGWKLETIEGTYAKSYSLHGAQISAGVREIEWSGLLPDKYFDEFAFQAYLSSDWKPGDEVLFPVVQECEQGVARWIDKEESATPAPKLKIIAKP